MSIIHRLSGQPTFFPGWPLIALFLNIHLHPVFNSLTCTSLSFTFHLPTTYPFNYMLHWPLTNNPRLCIIIFIDWSRVHVRFRFRWLLQVITGHRSSQNVITGKTLTSRPLSMKHLPRSSPYIVHDETKKFGSTPLPHPLDATAKI